jgi:hypothetical protein
MQQLAAMDKPIKAFGAEHAGQIAELGSGFQVSRSAVTEALTAHQFQMAQDLRELGMGEHATAVEARLGVSPAAPSQRQH